MPMKISKLPRKYSLIYRNLKKVLSDPERKSIPKICWEFLLCSFSTKSIAQHYLSSFLYRRHVHNILDYLSPRESRRIQEQINDPKVADIITNKLSFCEHFERGGFAVPKTLGYILLNKMYLKLPDRWNGTEFVSPSTLSDAFGRLMDEWNKDEIFLKPIRGTEGVGAYRVSQSMLESPLKMERIYSTVVKDGYLLQEVVQQHPELNALNPNALNTIRIDTFREPAKKGDILSAFLRIGAKGNFVDNISAGGFFVGIDLENGTLKEYGQNLFHGSEHPERFRNNPLNGSVLKGYSIPLFDEVKRIVLLASEWIPSGLLGWDVAIGVSGPVLIEANYLYYSMRSSDLSYGGYRRHPVFQNAVKFAKSN